MINNIAQPRERKKAEKRERIRRAALELFSERGYEATALRDVARKAHVALGTLSLYAKDKRDLTLLVFNTHINELTTKAAAAAWHDSQADLLMRLLAFFGTYYRDFNRNPTLARVFLQLNYYSSGMHGAEYQVMTARVANVIETIVRQARSDGEIAKGESSELIARHFFFVFSAAVRWWIADTKPNLSQGLDELTRLLRIQIAGLQRPFDDTKAIRRKAARGRAL